MRKVIDSVVKLTDMFVILAETNIHHSFMWALANYLGTQLSYEDFTHWIEKNKSVIKNNLNNRFDLIREPISGKSYLGSYVGSPDITWIKLYKSNAEPESFDIKEAMTLQSTDKIPALWLYLGNDSKPTSGLENLPTDVIHEAWLAMALSRLTGSDRIKNNYDLNEIVDFLRDKKSIIDELRQAFVTLPKEISTGTSTSIYSIGPNLVLKVFSDPTEFDLTRKALNRLWQLPEMAKTEAMIYDLGTLGSFRGVNVFYSIMEKMKPVDQLNDNVRYMLTSIIDFIGKNVFENRQMWRPYKEHIDNPKYTDLIKKTIMVESKKILDMLNKKFDVSRIEQHLPSLRSNWLLYLVEEIIMKFLTSRGDLHLGNLGLTGYGDFRYYDPAHGSHTEHLNAPSKLFKDLERHSYDDIEI